MEKINLTDRDIELLEKYVPKVFDKLEINNNTLIYDDEDLFDEVFIELNFSIVEHGLSADQNETNELGRELYGLHDKIF